MNFYHYYKSRKGKMLHLLKEVVHRESPSNEKKAVDACSSFVIGEFKKTGAKVTRFPQKETGDFYLAEYPPSGLKDERSQVLILTHIDTVWPVGKIKKMPFYVSRNKVYGPGALDMKVGIVMALFALKALKELNAKPKRNLSIFINSAEEVGNETAYEVIRTLSKKSEYVLCLEPALPDGGVKIQRKGRLVVRAEAKGKAAHAGTPEKGINAVDELMFQIRTTNKLRSDSISINVGQIGGGEKPNIVPSYAWAMLDIRFWTNAQKDRILKSLKQLKPKLHGAKIKFSVEKLTPPMEKTKPTVELLSKVREIASAKLDMELKAGKSGGGSDASIASNLGVPTLDGLGPVGEGIHAEKEHFYLNSLIERTALLTEILIQL
jgi:glutamate carboxypeptidase